MQAPGLAGFYDLTRAAKKIVVMDLGFLGDTLHSVPAFCEIKRHYPAAALHVLTTPVGAEVLGMAPCVDRPWRVTLDPAERTLADQLRLIRALRRERFDVAFSFSGADRANILGRLSGARWRAAQTGPRDHFWNSWLTRNWMPGQNSELTVFEQRRQMLAACGFNLESPRFDLKVDEESQRWAAKMVPEGALHLSINSNNPLKEWPVEHYVEMLQSVWQLLPALQVVTSATIREREQKRAAQLETAVKDVRLQRLPAKLTIPQLAGVLRRCRLHVGSDSGVMHLAMALGVPTISFFRAQGGYKSWLPLGANQLTLIAPCTCIDHHSAPCEQSWRAECLARIRPGQVVEMICDQMKAPTVAASPV